MDVELLNIYYEELIHPPTIIKYIKDFDGWLELGSKEDLKCCLEAFAKADMFEECIIIQNKIDGKG